MFQKKTKASLIGLSREASVLKRFASSLPLKVIVVVVCICLLGTGWVFAFRQYQSEVLIKASRSLTDRGRSNQAESAALLAIQLNPLDGYGWFQYATALYTQRKFEPAILAFSNAIPTLPHFYNAVRLMAISQYQAEMYEKAADNFSSYLAMNPAPAITPELIYRMAGLSALRTAALAAANNYLAWATYFSDDKADLLRVRAMISILLNQPDSADYYFRAFRFLEKEKEFNPYELVANAIAANKVAGAIEFMEYIRSRNPRDLSVVKALAIAYSRQGNHGRAEEIVASEIQLHPDNAELRLIYGDLLYAQKKTTQAFAAYDRHLELDPDSQFRKDILQKKATSRY